MNRAKVVYELYSRYTEFNPVQLHTGIKSVKRREAIRQQIINGESRIVVCVDALGEGFDLPELNRRFSRHSQDVGGHTPACRTLYTQAARSW